MRIGHAFGQQETHYVVGAAQYNGAPCHHKNTRLRMAGHNKVGAGRQPHNGRTHHGDNRGKPGDNSPEARLWQSADKIGHQPANALYNGYHGHSHRIAEGLRYQLSAKQVNLAFFKRKKEHDSRFHAVDIDKHEIQKEIGHTDSSHQVEPLVQDARHRHGYQRLNLVDIGLRKNLDVKFGIDARFHRSQRIEDDIRVLQKKPGLVVQHPCQQGYGQQDDKKGYKEDSHRGPALAPMLLFNQVFHRGPPQYIKHDRGQESGKKLHQAGKKKNTEQQYNRQEEVFIDLVVGVVSWHVFGFWLLNV